MTLIFSDSFDHYTISTPKWSAGMSGTIGASAARLGAAGLTLSNGNSAITVFPSSAATWIIGAAMQITGGATGYATLNDAGSGQLTVSIDATGIISVRRGASNGTVIASTSGAVIVPNVWFYLELKATIDNSAGSYEVRVNGSNVLSNTGVDTQSTTNASANGLTIGSFVANTLVDDLYVCDSSGATNNNFLGDVRVQVTLPNGAGANTAWTPSAGTNYTCVDDAAPNGDTDYVSSSTVNQVDTYAFGSLTPTTGTVYGVTVYMYARKDDAGPRTIAPVVRSGGTDYAGTAQALSTSYQYLKQVYETNPNTAAQWTIAGVNAAEFGVKLTA